MKKLKLNLANMPSTEVLSREQLKKITGGAVMQASSECPDGQFWCTCDNGSDPVEGFCTGDIDACYNAC